MFTLPEGPLADLDAQALSDAIDAGLAAYRELGLTEDSDEATVASAEEIVAAVRTLRAEAERRTEVSTRAAALVAEMSAEPVEAPEPTAEAEAVVEAEAAVAEAEAATEAAATEPETEAAATEPEPVVAAGAPKTKPAANAAKHAPAPVLPKEKNVSVVLTAAADVPGFATGGEMKDGIDSLGEAVIARMKGLPTAKTTVQTFNRYGTALIEVKRNDGLTQDNPDYRDDQALIDAAGREARLSGGSLIAAGGWCAPSETLYDLCEGETTDGIIDIPTVGITRGGIRYTMGPDFGAIYGGTGYFSQTEAQAIAGTAKTCMEVPCPAFVEVRLDAVGVCIKAPILTNAGYPELVRRFISGALVAQAHKVGNAVVAKMKTAAGTALAPVDQGATSSTLEALAWVAEGLKQKYRLGNGTTLEVVLPHWAPQSLREDIARRTGRSSVAVTDAEINGWFTERNLKPQFVYGLQDLVVTTLPLKPPASMDVLIYPAGTFVKGTAPVINLDTVYDSTDLANNLYTALFTEEGVLVAQRCPQAALVTVPVCDSGRSGMADLNSCFGTVEA